MVDPDLTVKLIPDAASALAPWFDFLKTIAAAGFGAAFVYWTTRRAEKVRATEALKTLAGAAAAELAASRGVLQEAEDAAQKIDAEHNFDTITYGRLPDDPTPLVRAAFEQAGRFPSKIATELAQYMLLQRQLRQHVETLQTMHAANVLTDKKNTARRMAMTVVAAKLKLSMQSLELQLTLFSLGRKHWLSVFH